MKSRYLKIGIALMAVLLLPAWAWYTTTQWEDLNMSFRLEDRDESLPFHGQVLHITGEYNRYYGGQNNLQGTAVIGTEEWKLMGFSKEKNGIRTLTFQCRGEEETGETRDGIPTLCSWVESGYLNFWSVNGVTFHHLRFYKRMSSNARVYKAIPLD